MTDNVLVGTPSDEAAGILAVGRSRAGLVFVSWSARHPEGRDADYLAWHTLDHRPEQHRIGGLVTSLRLVSTPECRAARAASTERFDAVDHVMNYFFTGAEDLKGFEALSAALYNAGRNPGPLPSVERGTYAITGRAAAARIKTGADVLPWWPVRGMYVLVEEGEASPADLVEVAGVGGAWWGATGAAAEGAGSAATGGAAEQVTYLYLDGDPVEVAGLLAEPLQKRWASGEITPLLAAPFHTVTPYEWDRYVP